MALKIHGLAPLIQVFDMPTSVRFYCDMLGFRVVSASNSGERFDWALLRKSSVELMLNTAYEDDERPSAPDPDRVAAHADTALYFACDDVDAAYRHCKKRGLAVAEPRIRTYGMKQLYVRDPDGYELCFQSRVDQ